MFSQELKIVPLGEDLAPSCVLQIRYSPGKKDTLFLLILLGALPTIFLPDYGLPAYTSFIPLDGGHT